MTHLVKFLVVTFAKKLVDLLVRSRKVRPETVSLIFLKYLKKHFLEYQLAASQSTRWV